MAFPYKEWDVQDGLILTVTITDEGVVFDLFDRHAQTSRYTEAMTADEWADWMKERR